MILGGAHLKKQFASGAWKAFDNNLPMGMEYLDKLINANSIDLTLSPSLLKMGMAVTGVTNLYNPVSVDWVPFEIPPEGFTIHPYDFYLAATEQRFETLTPITIDKRKWYFTQEVHGRSTIGRCGLAIHVTAGYGDYGFTGTWTLELVNHTVRPIIIYPHMRICQLEFHSVFEPLGYTGVYSCPRTMKLYQFLQCWEGIDLNESKMFKDRTDIIFCLILFTLTCILLYFL